MKARIALLSLVLLLSARGTGQASQSLTFRGPIHDSAGKALTSPAKLSFRIYDAPAGGNLLAGPFESGLVVPIDGEFSATFGPIPADRIVGNSNWLEISVGSSPVRRIELEKVYYDGVDQGGKLVGGRLLVQREVPNSAPTGLLRSASPVTTILNNGPSSNRLDLVFVGDGYVAAELGTYAVHVQNVLNYLLSQEPFATYRNFFNAHRVDVVSNESGVDNDPVPGILKDTALDMGFYCGGTERLLCVNVGDALLYAADAPAAEQVFAVANSVKYGGAGYITSDLATVSGGNGAATEVAVHEMGHSLGNLADEYDYDGPPVYTGPEPAEPNVSILRADAMAASGTKWARWLGDPGVGFGGLVDTYEGANYSAFGIYRPTANSKMRSLGVPFNLPSVESLILEFYRFVRPIDAATDPEELLDQFSVAFVDPVDLEGHPLEIQWYVDGTPIEGATQDTFLVAAGGFALGPHTLSVTVRDNTSLVRDETARLNLMTESRQWNVNIGDRTPRVTTPATVTALEGTAISFEVTAQDPDGEAISSFTATGPAITAGGVFTVDPSNTSGAFAWTPTLDQAGIYDVTFTASNVLSKSRTTRITVNNLNQLPVVTAPVTVNASHATAVTFDVSVTDPDQDVVTLSAAPLPPGAAFQDRGDNSGFFFWVPDLAGVGSYHVTFTARDPAGALGTAETAITIVRTDHAPEVVAASRSANEGESLTLVVTASDVDGDPIQSLSASPLPSGATFVPDATNATGTLEWTPDYSQAGVYPVKFTASNSLTGIATATITVADVGRLPVITVSGLVNAAEAAPLTVPVSVTDPDGSSIDSLTASSLPPGATFTANGSKTSGLLGWTPDYDQAGAYSVTISAKSACRADVVSGVVNVTCEESTAPVAIVVGNTDRAPVLTAPASLTVDEGAVAAFMVTAADPDGERVASLEALDLPFGATFTPALDFASGEFEWAPTSVQAGEYTIEFSAGNALSGSAATVITVRDVNRPPVADAGGPYFGVAGVGVAFDGSGSVDPDGQALQYDWTFGDLSGTSGPAPSHTYVASGVYTVILSVTDAGAPSLTGTDTSTATIQDLFAARVYAAPANQIIRLNSGKPTWCAQVEPTDADFALSDVDLGSLALVYVAGGVRREIPGSPGRASIMGDKDGNGVPELAACFSKSDLRTLFAGLLSGRSSVTVAVEGELISGGRFTGSVSVSVLNSGSSLAVTMTPNPLSPEGTLTVSMPGPGFVRVMVYDITGRLVRSLVNEAAGGGYQDVRIDGRDQSGKRLPSGIYFYRIEVREGAVTGRFAIMR